MPQKYYTTTIDGFMVVTNSAYTCTYALVWSPLPQNGKYLRATSSSYTNNVYLAHRYAQQYCSHFIIARCLSDLMQSAERMFIMTASIMAMCCYSICIQLPYITIGTYRSCDRQPLFIYSPTECNYYRAWLCMVMTSLIIIFLRESKFLELFCAD